MKPLSVNKWLRHLITGLVIVSPFITFLFAQSLEFGPPVIVVDDLSVPCGLAVDQTTNRVFVANTARQNITFTELEQIMDTPLWAEFGHVNNPALPEALDHPQGIATDQSGNIYVADTYHNEAKLYRWNLSEDKYVLDPLFTAINRNEVEGVLIHRPRDIATGPDGKIYLLDSGNDRILVADGPTDDSWEVWRASPDWGNPYGMDVTEDGQVFIADTDHHQVLKLNADGSETAIGSYGTGTAGLRFPRDVAIGPDGRIFVADTYNHRIQIFKADGTYYRIMGGAPLFGKLEKIEVDQHGRVFVVDSELNRLVAYLGPDTQAPFDAYVRDYLNDNGQQPSSDGFTLASPDILIRHQADVDLDRAETEGLTSYGFQQPRFGQNNYVYLAVRNRGRQEINGFLAKLYWLDPDGQTNFPAHWHSDGFFEDENLMIPDHTFYIPSISAEKSPTGESETHGMTILGPLIWSPPRPERSITGEGRFYIAVRLVHISDPTEDVADMAFADRVRLNNNIACRKVEVSKGPFPVGEQRTLVVRANFSAFPNEIDATALSARFDATNDWLKEVSYDTTFLSLHFRGPVILDFPKYYYTQHDRHLLVELPTEVLSELVNQEPNILDGSTSTPEDDINRVVITLNDPRLTESWSTSGPWPYDLGLEWSQQFGSYFNYGHVTGTYFYQNHLYVVGNIGEIHGGDRHMTLPGEVNRGGQDVFVIKYDRNGKWVWHDQFGTYRTDEAVAISGDDTGIYILGNTYGAFRDQVQHGGQDAFVRKYSYDGEHVWTDQFGAQENPFIGERDYGTDIFASSYYVPGVYVIGETDGTFPGQQNSGSFDIFLRKYSAEGELEWTQQFGKQGWDFGRSVYAKGDKILVAGKFTEDYQEDWGNAFVRAFYETGESSWSNEFGDPQKGDAAVEVFGNEYFITVLGGTAGALDGETNAGGPDIFLKTYDYWGRELWSDQFGTEGYDEAFKLHASLYGVFIIGRWGGEEEFFIRMYDLWDDEEPWKWSYELEDVEWTEILEAAPIALPDFGLYIDPSGIFCVNDIWSNHGHSALQQFDFTGSRVANSTLSIGRIHDDPAGVFSDDTGVYIFGSTDGAFSFPEGNTGAEDGFVRKFNLQDQKEWTYQFGTVENDEVTGMYRYGDRVFMTGSTRGLFSGQLDHFGTDGFIRCYDTKRERERWTTQFGTETGMTPLGIDGVGETLYIAGDVSGGSTSPAMTNIFLSKIVDNGQMEWVNEFGTEPSGTSYTDKFTGITIEADHVFISGSTDGAFSGFTNLGDFDCFLQKFDPDGNLIWTRQFGSDKEDRTKGGIVSDPTGIYLSGHTRGTLPNQTRHGHWDAFVRKYDFNGHEIWTHQFGTDRRDQVRGSAIFNGYLYVVGETYGSITGQQISGNKEAFVFKFDQEGKEIWRRQRYISDDFFIKGCDVNSPGIYITGTTEAPLHGEETAGGKDVFVLKFETEGKYIRMLSVSVEGMNNAADQTAYDFAHQLGLKDLSIHENVDFPLPYTAGLWDNMAQPHTGVHPLIWSKELASWVTSSGGLIEYISRPYETTAVTVDLSYQNKLEEEQYGAVAIGLTNGVTAFEEESHFYWVEARSPHLGDADSAVPAEGVIVYYANNLIPEGQGPVVVFDYTKDTPIIEDASLPVGACV